MKLDQVITNLVSNAVRYGGQGPVAVTLRREAGAAVLVVQDRGIGIGDGDLALVFDRYHKGTNSRAHGGLGLGLYITRRIVEAHGGSIGVESQARRRIGVHRAAADRRRGAGTAVARRRC